MDDGQSQISQMLQGADGSGRMPLQGPPQANQPTGMPGPFDPAKRVNQVMVKGLKKLSQIYHQLGDPQLGNKVDKMAVDLEKDQIGRDAHLKKQISTFQQNPGGPTPGQSSVM